MPSERDKATWTDPGPDWRELQRWQFKFKPREFPTTGCLLVLLPPIVMTATYCLVGIVFSAIASPIPDQGAMLVAGTILYIVAGFVLAAMLVGVGLLLKSWRQATPISSERNASDKIPWWLWCFGISGMFIVVLIIVNVAAMFLRSP